MRWNIGGPDLPPELLQSVEDGRVVLFCGAGISRPAGLPGFCGLIEAVYLKTNEEKSELEQSAFESKNFDQVLGLLENRIGRDTVRNAVVKALELPESADLPTHRSLLALATNRDGTCRLVTTNFDRGFESVAGSKVPIDDAPKLPVPKTEVWNSIVHLHGRISDDDPQGRSLVMTSADFGSAYLTERWASRFLSELFRRFTVLFVGYRVEDPVVRYMMDAFAADRALGEGVGKAFVLAGCGDTNDPKEARAWESKGLTPILYDSKNEHAALHQTLSAWATCHSQGLLGKESIVQEYASKVPTKPFDQDPVISQIVWALREESGHVASVFARLEPVPPVEWLDVLEEKGLLALPCVVNKDQGWKVPLVDGGRRTAIAPDLNPISSALGGWLIRHLDKPAVLNWVLRSGSVLHTSFRRLIRRQLAEGPEIPSVLRQIWRVLASEATFIRTSGPHSSFELYKPLKDGEWNMQLKQAVIVALAPVLELRPSITQVMFPDAPGNDESISQFVEIEVVPRCKESAPQLINSIDKSPIKQQMLSDLADDVTSLLNDAMQLFEMMQKAGPMWDWSYIHQPSISDHEQNFRLLKWTLILEFCRDTWTALLREDPVRARRLAERWRTLRYPVFRRLCFFAMTESDLYYPSDCLACALEDDGWWLWSIHVYREKFRLLQRIWPQLDEAGSQELITRIVAGPPRSVFGDDVGDGDFKTTADREVWILLSKLQGAGRSLPEPGAAKLTELSTSYPDWQLPDGDRAEFTWWMGHGFPNPPVEKEDEFINLLDAPVIERLGADETSENDLARWRHLTRENPARASDLLSTMARANVWPAKVWQTTMKSHGVKEELQKRWPELGKVLVKAPDSLIEEIQATLAWHLKEISGMQEDDNSRSLFWQVWDRLQPYAFRNAPEEVTDALTAALNTPPGYLTEALLDCIANMRPKKAADLPGDVWERLTSLTEGTGQPYKLARVLLASRLAWIHSLNPQWAENKLLRYFNWNESPEAPVMWHGFLWQARFTPALWPRIKPNFLDALKAKGQLGRSEEQICHLFGAICINHPDWLTTEETRYALRSLDNKGRAIVARLVLHRLEAAREQSEVLWDDQISPWLDQVWPKDLELRDPQVSLYLALAATHAGSSFPSAVDAIAPLLIASEDTSLLCQRLSESGIASRESQATLRLASKIVDTTCPWPNQYLGEVLNQIAVADAEASQQPVFRKLDEYLRSHNS